MSNILKRASKFMSLVLRHNPSIIDATLDENGWLSVNVLLEGMNRKGITIDKDLLEQLVRENDKKRFAFNEDQTKIRANQGHSVVVDVQLSVQTPPDMLYHGTVEKFIDSIFEQGIQSMNRQHVHLSADIETAKNVGARRGKPVILEINAAEMSKAGIPFYLSENGVWLTDEVNTEYISLHNQ